MSDIGATLARVWGYEAGGRERLKVAAAASCVTLVLAAAAFAAGSRVSTAAGVAAAVAAAGVAAAWTAARARIALRRAGPAQVPPGDSTRVEGLTSALAEAMGVVRPTVVVVAGEAPNALVVPGRKPVVAITRGAISLGRTELEALLVHSLLRAARGAGSMLALSAALGPVAPATPRSSIQSDVATVAVTHYPPALAAVLEKADVRRKGAPALWFSGASRAHAPRNERLALLADL